MENIHADITVKRIEEAQTNIKNVAYSKECMMVPLVCHHTDPLPPPPPFMHTGMCTCIPVPKLPFRLGHKNWTFVRMKYTISIIGQTDNPTLTIEYTVLTMGHLIL